MSFAGGTNAESDKRAVAKPGQDIFVGTPGRLLMLLQEQRSFAEQCAQTKVLVFDEADRLLDMGFKRFVSFCSHGCVCFETLLEMIVSVELAKLCLLD